MNLRRPGKRLCYQKAEIAGYHIPSIEGPLGWELFKVADRMWNIIRGGWERDSGADADMLEDQRIMANTQHSPWKGRAHNCFPSPPPRAVVTPAPLQSGSYQGGGLLTLSPGPGFVIQIGTSFPVHLLFLNWWQGCRAGEAVNLRFLATSKSKPAVSFLKEAYGPEWAGMYVVHVGFS